MKEKVKANDDYPEGQHEEMMEIADRLEDTEGVEYIGWVSSFEGMWVAFNSEDPSLVEDIVDGHNEWTVVEAPDVSREDFRVSSDVEMDEHDWKDRWPSTEEQRANAWEFIQEFIKEE